ncbi:MAG: site-specific DNA-methyltransferase [Caldilineaceae bacterium]|nr:site-specific DNA-methyltransferase [Caldilineaceae bacterium]
MPANREQNRQKLQKLLRDLFQFDTADLDFGIYKILHHRKDEIERFIQEDLLNAVQEALSDYAEGQRRELERELEQERAKVTQNLGRNAIDPAGRVIGTYLDVPLVQGYLALQERMTSADVAAETEAHIYNDLYTFFSRYYDKGDFLSKRRYSSKEPKYFIPYNGEEVLLHWANRDQYYVKTGEQFTDYRFRLDESGREDQRRVHFKIERAEVPQDNVKGDSDRDFVLRPQDPVVWDEEAQELVIYFEYRPMTGEEEEAYLALYNEGQTRKGDRYKTLDRSRRCFAMMQVIFNELATKRADDGLLGVLLSTRQNDRNLLEYHLNQYTARNTADYFVHKDLGGFLRSQLDFYLKNEVLHIDDLMGSVSPGDSATIDTAQMERVLRRGRVIRHIAEKIITFLAQIEDFQKRLFEKKKFVIRTDYCVTLDRVPEILYGEILVNQTQLDAWQELYAIDQWQKDLLWQGEFNEEFLHSHPYAMVDTRHFGPEFVDYLLASFEDLDNQLGGILIKSENFQALSLGRNRFKNRVKCIHIDPPYNTQTSGFLYKNSYQHSSWLAMMENRVQISLDFLTNEGSFLCHIDENEYERLHLLMDGFDMPDAGTIAWDKRNPMNAGRGIATQHEYVIWRTKQNSPIYLPNRGILAILWKAAAIVGQYNGVTEEAKRDFASWISGNTKLSGGEKAYRFLDENGKVYQSVSLRAPEPREDPKFHRPLIHPTTGRPCAIPANGFSRTPETLAEMISNGEILFGEDETTQPRQKMVLTEDKQRQISSVLQEGKKGKADVDRLGLEFPYCHPVSLYKELIGAASTSPNDVVLDFFAGSATTAHATLALNREDEGSRRYILVEMGDYFDTVVLPRVIKVVFSDKWKNGIPQDKDGISHMIKVQRLESYEDALNNVHLAQPVETEQQTLFGEDHDEYLLSYMLDNESRNSPTLLAQDAFDTPFDYKLNIQRGTVSPQPQTVDLVETFHYLIGLHVKTLRAYRHQDRRYRVSTGEVTTATGVERVAVVWRNTADLDLGVEKSWIMAEVLHEHLPLDRIYINGTSYLPNAQPLDLVFRQKMEEGVRGN